MVIRITGNSQRPDSATESSPNPTPFRMFEELFNNWALQSTLAHRQEVRTPPVDIYEKDGKIIIRMEIPGTEEKDIDLKLDGRTLTIKGERKGEGENSGFSYHQVEGYYGKFQRSFTLPDTVDAEKISATSANGVLAITIPQKPESKPLVIKVNKG